MGHTGTWTSEGVQDGRPVQQKMTMQILSPKRYTLTFEISMHGKNWLPFMQGKATKK